MPIFLWSFVALGAAIVATWFPRSGVWPAMFVTALTTAFALDVIAWPALLIVAMFALSGGLWRFARKRELRIAGALVAIALSLLLMRHALPGFHNPIIFQSLRLSEDALAYTQYLNFDKAMVGLLLSAWIVRHATG